MTTSARMVPSNNRKLKSALSYGLMVFLLLSLHSQALAASGEPGTPPPVAQPQSQSADSDTYLAVAAANGAARWPANRFPISYFIEPGDEVSGYKPAFKKAVEAAMNAWTNVSGGKIQFLPVDKNNATLQIGWTNDKTKMISTRELGHAEIICDINGIASASILLLTKQINGECIGDIFAKRIALHELGHALGILGHSPNPDDVMYASTTPSENPNLSQKDVNTILTLYSPAGDLLLKDVKFDKLTELGPNATPKLQAMHLNAEGTEALKAMKFAEAIQKFDQAHKIDPTNQVVISNLGGTYANVAAIANMMHKPADCDSYFKKAIAMLELSNNRAALVTALLNYSSILKSNGKVDDGNKIDAKIRALNAGK